MRPRPITVSLFALLISALQPANLLAACPEGASPSPAHPPALAAFRAMEAPLAFEANRGQSDAEVRFLARGGQGGVFLTPAEAVITRSAASPNPKRGGAGQAVPPPAVLRLSLRGANPNPLLRAEGGLPGTVNYYRGNDRSRWIEGVPTCSRVRYGGVYPGVDLVFYGNGKQLEYDFVLAPGVRPEQIELRFKGLGGDVLRPRLNEDGNLVLKTPGGEFVQKAPRAWQERGAERIPVASGYLLKGRGLVGFRMGPYDRSLPLVIDPTLLYSTYLGGSSGDSADGVAVDSSGNAIVTGETSSSDFPRTDGSVPQGSSDVFVAKYDPTGTGLVFSTLLGGTSFDKGRDVAVDSNGAIYVTGETGSPGYPVLNGYPFSPSPLGESNAFLTKLSPGGTLLFSTLIMGSSADRGTAVAVASPGFVYVTGSTQSPDFITMSVPLQPSLRGSKDAFLTFVDTNLGGEASIAFSSWLGGTDSDEGNAIAADAFSHIFLAGETSSSDFPEVIPGIAYQSSLGTAPDGFFCEITIPQVGGYPSISYASYLGGNGMDVIEALAAQGQSGVRVAGFTDSSDFPQITPLQGGFGGGATDAFVSIFNTQVMGSASLGFSTYFGGQGADFIHGLASDPDGHLLLAGTTTGLLNFPIVHPLPGMGTYRGGPEDAFVARIVFPVQRPQEAAAPPSLGMCSFLGGTGDEYAEGIATDSMGDVVVVGATNSSDFPLQNSLQAPGGLYDAFVTKISLAASPCSVTCAASVSPASGFLAQPFSFSSSVTPSGCTGSPAYLWDFGDGSTSSVAFPVHVYSAAGTYYWSLTVTVDAETCVQTGSVTVLPCAPSCSATANVASGFAPLGVTFAASASGCTGTPTYDWDFGDGSAHSTSADSTHGYTVPGSYAWTMTATQDGSCARTGQVVVREPASGVPVAWGFNSYGQAGDVAANQSSVPAPVPGLSGLTGLSAGYYHVLAVDAGGSVWAWGNNFTGQLGNGTTDFSSSPQVVPGISGASAVAGGGYHSLAVVAGGAVKAWGDGWFGQLGQGLSGGSLSPVSVTGLTGITAVAAGGNHSLALKSDGTVWAWGLNAYGQLGDTTLTDRNMPVQVSSLTDVVAIAAGHVHSVALRGDGSVWAWGRNVHGQLGNGTSIDSSVPIQVSALTGVTAIACGLHHGIAVTSSGTVKTWGNNAYGQLGDGSHTTRYTPVSVTLPGGSPALGVGAGCWHTLVARADGSVLAWGNDWFGECGGGPFDQKTTPVTVAGATGVSQLTAGWGFCLARRSDGTAVAWGLNDMGQLGDGRPLMRLSPAAVAGLTNANALALGAMHGLALQPDGTVKGWGNNEEGQLGTGGQTFSSPMVTVSGLTAVAGVAAGWFHSLAVKQDGTVWSWGNGPHGDGTWTQWLSPGQVPGLTGFTAVAAGMDHCLALKGDGTVYAWGDNPRGQLGDGTTTDRYTPVQVQGLTGVVAIASNDTAAFSLALKGDGTVWAWGDNSKGQLGDGTTLDRLTPVEITALGGGISAIAAGNQHALALNVDGIVYAWGNNASGQVGVGPTTERLTPVALAIPAVLNAIAAGDMHSLALASDGSVWGWGANFGGQTGSGNTAAQLLPLVSPLLRGVTAIAAGGDASMALVTCTLDCDAAVPADAAPGVPVTFTSTVMPGPGCMGSPAYAWTFGDGGTSSQPSPVYTYATEGNYAWSLTVTVDGIVCSKSGGIAIALPCTLTCTATVPATGITGQPLAFASTATASNCTATASYDWDFGDGSAHETAQNTVHTYAVAGDYAWTLTASVDGVTCTQTGSIMVSPPCTLTCTATVPATGVAGVPVSFASTGTPSSCTGGVTYDWDFGDGTAHETAQNTVHTYAAAGDYTWTLTASVDGVTCTQTGSISVQAQVPSTERDALIALYNSAGGPNWTYRDNWLGPVGSEGTWHGVTLDVSMTHVVGLQLGSNNLQGTIPPEIGSLANLQLLGLSSNGLTGGIPAQLGNLSNLQELGLSSNQLSGAIPPELGSLTSLQALDLAYNQLSGSIPSQLATLANLQYLRLQSNQLSGGIPTQLGGIPAQPESLPSQPGSLASLLSLDFGYNQLSGSIPPQLGSLVNLQELRLNDNQLSGSIPTELGNLAGLQVLKLDGNQLSGTIPAELGNLTNLYYLKLFGNQLSGAIPAQLGNLTNLQYLWLSGNQLAGSVPASLANLTGLYDGFGLDLQWNALHTEDLSLLSFLNAKQYGGDWTGSQTVPPTNLVAAPSGPNHVLLGWTPIAYAGDSGYYLIQASTSNLGPFLPIGTTGDKSEASFLAGGLQPHTAYWFVVQTVTLPHGSNQSTVSSEATSPISATTPCQPVCMATASPETGAAPLTVLFTGSVDPSGGCNGTPTYDWDFGDGSAHGTTQNVSHTYAAAGTYTWTLTALVEGVTCTQTGSILVSPPCTLSCSAIVPASGIAGQPLPFSATATPSNCSGTPAYDWDFGDGSAHGTAQNLEHAYPAAGDYTWTLTASVDGLTCTKVSTITIVPCELSCAASVTPGAGTTETSFAFSAIATSLNCAGKPLVDWDFGDDSAHSWLYEVGHTYASPGTYTWTMTASKGTSTCTKSGQVFVAQVQQGSLQGFVGICATTGFWPLAGTGVHDLKVEATDTQGQTTLATMSGASYSFGVLPPGTYTVIADMYYEDAITIPNGDLPNAGCAAPGVVLKHAWSAPTTVVISGTDTTVQNLCFPPPLVLLHGSLKCYQQWWDGDPEVGDTRYWDNMARSEGAITFTPNYHWWGADASWGESVEQVLSQLIPDLSGLVGTLLLHPSPAPNTAAAWPPYAIVAHDMGGLVARVLTSGRHRGEDVAQAITRIVLLGTPNSGSDTLFGGGRNRVMSTDVIINRFNLVYPDFGDKTDRVFAIGGTDGWWRMRNSDGRVTLYSAFTITRVVCSPDAFGYPVCEPYAYLSFASEPEADHLFHYTHDGLTGGTPAAPTDSSATILKALLLPALRLERAIPGQAARTAPEAIAPDGDPESPVGMSIWGTNNRTSGSAKGQIPGGLAPTQAREYAFTIGDTDGMGVVIFVTQGSGLFEIFRPDGSQAASATVSDEYLYTELAPPASTDTAGWTLRVTAGPGGVTFNASFIEDGSFGVKGYTALDHYSPGDPVTLRVDLEGDRTGVTVSTVVADISDLSDNPLATVTLAPVSGPASGAYSGSWTLPPGVGGAYKVAFSTQGTFRAKRFERQSFTAVQATSPTRLFTGAFSDEPLDRNGDGLYDAVRFTAQVAFQRGGYYVMGADLYDADGAFLDHAATARDIYAAGTVAVDLTFDLRGTYCSQFGRPFEVRGLQLVDGATLNPLDVWNTIATATYASGTFQCLPGVPPPKIRALRPDQGVQRQVLPLLVGGRGFKDGAALTFDSGITVGPVLWLSDNLLSTTLTIQPAAAPGLRSLTVTNPGGATDTLAGAFMVTVDQPPTVTLLTPSDGVRLKPGDPAVRVSATASDDVRVTQVEFLVDATVAATDTEFPFTWDMPSSSLPAGSHTLTAKAYDHAGHTAADSIGVIMEDPPVIASLIGKGSPWALTIGGSNFKAGLSVYIGADVTPWPNLKLKSSTLLKVKGGTLLKRRFPKGQAVAVRVRNPDGSEAVGIYTR